MEGFERWTKIIILRWTSGRIVDHGLSDSRTDSDAFCGYRNEAESVVGGRTRTVHLVWKCGRRWTDGQMDRRSDDWKFSYMYIDIKIQLDCEITSYKIRNESWRIMVSRDFRLGRAPWKSKILCQHKINPSGQSKIYNFGLNYTYRMLFEAILFLF